MKNADPGIIHRRDGKLELNLSVVIVAGSLGAGPSPGNRSEIFPNLSLKASAEWSVPLFIQHSNEKENFFSGAMSGKQISRAEREHKGGRNQNSLNKHKNHNPGINCLFYF